MHTVLDQLARSLGRISQHLGWYPPLNPPSINHLWGIFYGDAHIPVKHRVSIDNLPQNGGFGDNIDQVK